ncbi:MAG: hypothetical protein FJ264_04855 [Planctomycetes bacterium]|nr:hypothetical protein [Planctomycetota bacterium]
MVKDPTYLQQFERNLKKRERPDYHKNMEIFEGMYKEAVYLKVIPLINPLEGVEVDIRIARVINSV